MTGSDSEPIETGGRSGRGPAARAALGGVARDFPPGSSGFATGTIFFSRHEWSATLDRVSAGDTPRDSNRRSLDGNS
jgi:hypothetical protein